MVVGHGKFRWTSRCIDACRIPEIFRENRGKAGRLTVTLWFSPSPLWYFACIAGEGARRYRHVRSRAHMPVVCSIIGDIDSKS
jgi:hypothetical protein